MNWRALKSHHHVLYAKVTGRQIASVYDVGGGDWMVHIESEPIGHYESLDHAKRAAELHLMLKQKGVSTPE